MFVCLVWCEKVPLVVISPLPSVWGRDPGPAWIDSSFMNKERSKNNYSPTAGPNPETFFKRIFLTELSPIPFVKSNNEKGLKWMIFQRKLIWFERTGLHSTLLNR